MADRIIAMRTTLYDLLQELGSKKEWGHIKSQIGMVGFALHLCDSERSLTRASTSTVLLHRPHPRAGRQARFGPPRLPDQGRSHLCRWFVSLSFLSHLSLSLTSLPPASRRSHPRQRSSPRRVDPRRHQVDAVPSPARTIERTHPQKGEPPNSFCSSLTDDELA